jgi:hypothetical protein
MQARQASLENCLNIGSPKGQLVLVNEAPASVLFKMPAEANVEPLSLQDAPYRPFFTGGRESQRLSKGMPTLARTNMSAQCPDQAGNVAGGEHSCIRTEATTDAAPTFLAR